MSKIFILGDIHFPFHKQEAIDKVLKAIKKEKPTHVLQIGDLYDQYNFSKYTRTMYSDPNNELIQARNLAIDLWDKIQRIVPKAECIQILGNHDVRIAKRITEKIPELFGVIINFQKEWYTFDKVKTIHDYRQVIEIDGTWFNHGYLSKLGDHMKTQGRSMVVGHSHTGGVVFEQRNGKTLFELNVGFLADEMQGPMMYRPTTTSRWTLGYGIVEDGQPRFVSL